MVLANAVIEIPKGSNKKYEHVGGVFKITRKLKSNFPENYGYIEKTISSDKEPLDVVVFSNRPLKQGRLKVKLLGIIMRKDRDDKLIAVPQKSKANNLKDLPKKRFDAIVNRLTTDRGQALIKIGGKSDAVSLLQKYKTK